MPRHVGYNTYFGFGPNVFLMYLKNSIIRRCLKGFKIRGCRFMDIRFFGSLTHRIWVRNIVSCSLEVPEFLLSIPYIALSIGTVVFRTHIFHDDLKMTDVVTSASVRRAWHRNGASPLNKFLREDTYERFTHSEKQAVIRILCFRNFLLVNGIRNRLLFTF
jgi:hypothetical protein